MSPLAVSYVDRAATDTGTLSIWRLPGRQRNTPLCLQCTCLNQFLAGENLGWISSSMLDFLVALGRRICSQSVHVYSTSTRCLCTILWLSTYRTYSHPAFLFFYGRPMSYVIGQTIIFCLWFLSSSSFFLFFSLPNVSGRRVDVYHTSTHGVALVRI